MRVEMPVELLTFINHQTKQTAMQKGDFIRIEYTGKVSVTGEIFDLTNEDVARKEGIYNEKHRYGPVLVIMGENMVVPGVEKQLEKMNPGDSAEFKVSPQDAFGSRDPRQIRIVSMAQFIKQNVNPMPGMFVTIDKRQARVQSVSGGRVRADFNHPLAGKELDYSVKVVEKITAPLEKIKSVIDYYGIVADSSLAEGRLTVKTKTAMPDVVQKLLAEKLKKWIPEIKDIKFVSEKKPEKTPETGQETTKGADNNPMQKP